MPAIAEPPAPQTVAEVVAAAPAAQPGELAASVLEQLMEGERPARAKAEPKQEPKPETKPATEAVKPTEAKPEPETKPEPKPAKTKPAAPAPAAPDYEKIAEASARGVAQAMQTAAAPAKPETAPDPLADLSDEEREEHEVYAQMEKDYPAQYKGKLTAQYLAYLKNTDKFEQDWLDQHPGQEFDPDSTEYREWQEKNAVKFHDLHRQKAIAKLALAQTREQDAGKLQAIEKREQLRAEEPKIVEHQAAVARKYFAGLGDDYKDVLDAAGNLNTTAIQEMVKADPLKSIALQTANQVEAFARELYTLARGLADFNPQNQAHQFIATYIERKESEMKSLPTAQQVNEKGQAFATAAEYNAMTADQRRRHWRYDHQDLADIFAVEQAKTAQASIAAEEKRIEDIALRRGFVKAKADNAVPATAAAPAAPPVPATPLTPSPSGAIEPRPALPNGQIVPPLKSAADTFTANWLG